MREVIIQQVSLGANGGLRIRPCPIGPSGYKYIWRSAMSVRWDEHDAELYVAYVGGMRGSPFFGPKFSLLKVDHRLH
jgi:hypothetical protein